MRPPKRFSSPAPSAMFSGRTASTQRSPTRRASSGGRARGRAAGLDADAGGRDRGRPRAGNCWCRRSRRRSGSPAARRAPWAWPTWSTRPSRMHRDAVGERQRLLLVVGHVDRRDAELALQLADLRAHLHAELGVEVGQRLVEQQDVGVRARARAPARPAAAGRRRAGPEAALEPGEVRPCAARRSSRARRSRPRRAGAACSPKATFCAHGHVRPERVVLEHHADVALVRRQRVDAAVAEADLARVRRVEAGDQPQQRRLAAAGRARAG